MRDIKFRAWDIEKKELHTDLCYLGEDLLMQYTGLKDKNGVEIYEGDILRIDIISDNHPNKNFDGLYRVQQDFKGVSFRFIDLAWKVKNKVFNQYPSIFTITSNYIHDDRWKGGVGCQYYEMYESKITKSTSITVIGNKFENPELLDNKEK